MYKKIGLALAFSPTCKAILAEAKRYKHLFQASLTLIHIGPKTEENENYLRLLMQESQLDPYTTEIIWEDGKPAKKILSICKREKIDLLLAGALKQENLYNYYVGSVARRILRKAVCSVMMLVEPSEEVKPIDEIVVDAEDQPYVHKVMQAGAFLGKAASVHLIHVVRELKLYGLAMSITSETSEFEKAEVRKTMVNEELQKVEQKLKGHDFDRLKVNAKIIAGKSGFELMKFTKRVEADLLIVSAPEKKFDLFDRVFRHDLEYIFADLPCNLLVVKG